MKGSFRAMRERLLREERERSDALELAATEARARLATVFPPLAASAGVTRAIVFGSLVWGGFHEESDVDILVFGATAAGALELALRLWDALDRPVDVVRAEAAPPSLVARALNEGELLHVA